MKEGSIELLAYGRLAQRHPAVPFIHWFLFPRIAVQILKNLSDFSFPSFLFDLYVSQGSPEKQNQWETYIELFQCFGLGDCGNGKSEIHRAAQETDTAILEQNFFFVEETSVLFLKPLN